MSEIYLKEIIKKFDFIQGIWVTDFEGALIMGEIREQEAEAEVEEKERNLKLKISLSFLFNSAIDQIMKIEKWSFKSLLSIYDNIAIYQFRLSKSIFVHFLCDSNTFNNGILNEISSEFKSKLIQFDKEVEQLVQNSDA